MSEEASRDYNDIYVPTIPQQRIISLLILPFCLLSFLGSSAIIRYILKDKKRSSYRRIMLAISVCDMIATVGYSLQSFLGPADSIRPYVYYMGNDTTCTALGAITQFSWSTHLYTCRWIEIWCYGLLILPTMLWLDLSFNFQLRCRFTFWWLSDMAWEMKFLPESVSHLFIA